MRAADDQEPRCEVCGSAPAVHITECHEDGSATTRHLCELHAKAAGLPVPSATEHLLPKLRAVIAFMKTNQRMPSPAEFRELGTAGGSSIEPGSDEFNRTLAYLEALVNFIEVNGRVPTQQELPDPS